MRLDEVQAVLRATPATLTAWLADLPDSLALSNEGGASWSPRDLVAHLIHGELEDWVPRAQRILDHGTSRPFEPFDPQGCRAIARGQQVTALLKRFAKLRKEGLAWLEKQAFTEEQLALRGTHPAFGEVTLHELLCTWAAHDLDHLGQVARVMARQFRPHVGPWAEYLPLVRG